MQITTFGWCIASKRMCGVIKMPLIVKNLIGFVLGNDAVCYVPGDAWASDARSVDIYTSLHMARRVLANMSEPDENSDNNEPGVNCVWRVRASCLYVDYARPGMLHTSQAQSLIVDGIVCRNAPRRKSCVLQHVKNQSEKQR